MKYASLAAALLLATSSANEAKPKSPKVKGTELAQGILNGTLGKKPKPWPIEVCIEDAEALFGDAEKLLTYYEKGWYIYLLEEVYNIYRQAMKSLSACDPMEENSKFKDLMSNEWNFLGSMAQGKAQLSEELKAAIKSLKEKDFEAAGEKLGEAATKVQLQQMNDTRKQNLAKVTQGFLNAYGGKFDLEALLFCIYDEDQAALMVDAAVQAFEQFLNDKTTSDKIGDLVGVGIGLFGAYQQFESGLPACEHVWSPSELSVQRIKKDMTMMPNAIKDLPQFANNIKAHEKEMLEMAHNVNGDMEKFGEFFGKFVQYATEKPTTWADVYPKDNREVATEILQGFFEGTNVGTFNFTNLLICIYEEDQAAIALYESVELFEQAWADKDWQEAVGGAIALVAAVQGAEQGLPPCEAIVSKDYSWGEFDKLAALSQNKEKTVKVVGENMLFNGVTITQDVVKAMKSFQAGNYKDFGYQMGNTLLLATKTEDKNLFLY